MQLCIAEQHCTEGNVEIVPTHHHSTTPLLLTARLQTRLLHLPNSIRIPAHAYVQSSSSIPLITPCPWGGALVPVLPSDAPPRTDQTAGILSILRTILAAPHTALDTAASWRAQVLATHCRTALRVQLAGTHSTPTTAACHPSQPPHGKPPWIPNGPGREGSRVGQQFAGGEGAGGCVQDDTGTTALDALQLASVQHLAAAVAVLLADVVRLVGF